MILPPNRFTKRRLISKIQIINLKTLERNNTKNNSAVKIDCAVILWQLINYLIKGNTLKTEQSVADRGRSKRFDQRECGQALDLLVLPS